MSTEMTEEIKAIRVSPFSGQQDDWDKWSKKYQRIAAERGYLKIMLGMEIVPNDAIDIEQKVDSKYLIPDDERKQMQIARKVNQEGYKDLQLSTSKLAFQLVSLAKTVDLPSGSLARAWAALKDEYDPSEGEEKINLEDFQNNKLLNAKFNITEWLAFLSTQVVKLKTLSHQINDDYLMTHILGSLPQEYSTVVDHAKIDWRNKALTLIQLKKNLKEKYMQLRKENGWAEDEMALAACQNSTKNQNKGSNQRKATRVIGRCHHCGKYGHKKVDCREWLKLTKEEQDKADREQQEKSEEKPKKNKDHIKCFNCNKMGHYASECPEKKPKDSSGLSSGVSSGALQ